MAQWLMALPALREDSGSVPSTHKATPVPGIQHVLRSAAIENI